MKVIPAIDLYDAHVVRLHKGDYDKKKIYSDNPLAIASEFVEAGSSIIHVVDLNAARSGDRSANRSTIEKIVKGLPGVKIQVGGGVRNVSVIKEILDLGVHRVILGTKAAASPLEIESWMKTFGSDRVLIGVDVADGRIRVQGWEKDGGFQMEEFLKLLEKSGCSEIVLTNIASDGTLSGVSLPFYENAVRAASLNIIVSGGVASLTDIESLARWNHPQITGVIAGTAIYEKKLDLKVANQRAADSGN